MLGSRLVSALRADGFARVRWRKVLQKSLDDVVVYYLLRQVMRPLVKS